MEIFKCLYYKILVIIELKFNNLIILIELNNGAFKLNLNLLKI